MALLAKLACLPAGETFAEFDEGGKRGFRQRRVAAKVLHEKLRIDADVKIEDARSETEFAHEARAGVFGGRLEIVDRSEEIILHRDPVGGDGMRDLHRGLAVEIGVVGKHSAEHRDVGSGVGASEDEFGSHYDYLAGKFPFGESRGFGPLFGSDEGKLRGARRGEVVLLLFLGALLACGFDFSE